MPVMNGWPVDKNGAVAVSGSGVKVEGVIGEEFVPVDSQGAILLSSKVEQKVYNRFFGFGDSITADGGRIIGDGSLPSVSVYRYNWHFMTQLLLDSKAVHAGSYGQPGYTIKQLLTEHLPKLKKRAVKGDMVVVLMGQNDLGGITPQTLLDYRACIEEMISVGLIPILCTPTPSITGITIQKLRSFIISLSQEKNISICDLYTACVDNTTGVWQATYNRDAVHPNQTGAKAMATVLASTLDKLILNNAYQPSLAAHNINYGSDRTTQTGGTPNPLLLTDNGATPPIPTGWTILAGSHSAATNLSSSTIGRKLKLTASAAQLLIRLTGSGVVGDTIRVSFNISTDVKAFSGSWGFSIANGGGVALLDVGRTSTHYQTEDVTTKTFVIDLQITGYDGVLLDFIVTGNGANITLSQISQINLTSLSA